MSLLTTRFRDTSRPHCAVVLKEPHPLDKARIESVDLRQALLLGASLTNADLYHCDLSGANLQEAKLSKAKMSGLSEPRVYEGQGYWLARVVFTHQWEGTDLSYANLKDADLTEAILIQTKLTNANLTGANLSNANLLWADLNGAGGLKKDQLSEAKNWQFAYYDEKIVKRLGLPLGHNESILQRKLAGLDLEGFNVMYLDVRKADLKSGNLRRLYAVSSDFSDSNMSGADLG